MYKLTNIDHFETTLKETSKCDDGKSEVSFMTDSEEHCYDFDKIKISYCDKNELSNKPSSCDALIIKNNKSYLIEFKNGIINREEIKKKLYDSLLIHSDLKKDRNSIQYFRNELEFILVYNSNKYNEKKMEGNNNGQNRPKEHKNLSKINEKIKTLPDLSAIERGFQGFAVERVRIVSNSRFDELIKELF